MTIQSGTNIGRYHILEQLGEGGMAVVYKAYDTKLECQVAIKFIRSDDISPSALPRVQKRFQLEAKKMAQLQHQNIVKVTDYGEFEGKPYLVMEYLQGGTLKDRLGQPMSWQEAAQILAPIANALSYAHKKGLIHRDIKPSNILITESGDPMLTDFGIAKILSSDETLDLTTTSMGVGTPEYMAPEQAENKAVDERTDIYSLGIVFYELVTGRKPFTADTPMAVIVKQIHDPLPQPGQFVKKLPVEVDHLLFKALAKNPQDRFQNMDEMTRAMGGLISGHGTIKKVSESKKGNDQPVERKPKKGILEFYSVWLTVGLGGLGLGIIFFCIIRYFGLDWTLAEVVNQTTFPSTMEAAEVPTPTENPTPEFEAGSSVISEIDGMTLLYVPAGEFIMGSNSDDLLANEDEFPQHKVYLDDFWIDQTEVTNAQYRLCVEAGACIEPVVSTFYDDKFYWAQHPVVYVNWNDAQTYCEWAGRRLPTEAEWEKAARGTDGRIYPWGNNEPNICLLNYDDNVGTSATVGSYRSATSPYGALDMAGNVWEWVSDWFDGGYYNYSPPENPVGPDDLTYRVIRGGSFSFKENGDTRAANRDIGTMDDVMYDRGFRCALDGDRITSITPQPVENILSSYQECRIAFVSDRDGYSEIYTMDSEGNNQTRLTFNYSGTYSPSWSPDGSQIAFESDLDGDAEIFVMNADGSNMARLTENYCYDAMPAWSPDGSKIAFISDCDGDNEIFTFTMDPEGNYITQLTWNENWESTPAWSNNSQQLVFASDRDGDSEIYRMNIVDGELTQLTFNDFSDWETDWSMDGSRIVFESGDGYSGEIYIMDRNGDNPIQLTGVGSEERYPELSADAAWIAFDSDSNGNYDIFYMDANGENITQLTFNAANDAAPTWSPACR